jgi:superfamily I DNA/RNA helicase/RecB family exonuclease
MDEHAHPGDLAERILSAAAPVVLLRGPAATGKTTAVLECYRRLMDDVGRPGCLLLAPNVRVVSRYRRRLLDASPSGVLIAPEVHTFAALAGRVLAAAGWSGRSLSALRRHLLLRHIVAELSSAGELPALGPLADAPGLVPTLEASIAELKRAAVEPVELSRAVGRARGKARDLLRVYERYQSELQQAETYDLEGRMWLARDRLAAARESGDAGLRGIRAVAADGFTDFTPTQLEMLRHLARLTGRVVLTLPLAEDGRERLWTWTRRTLERVREAFGGEMEEVELAAGIARPAPLRAAWDGAFTMEPGDDEPPPGLRAVSAPDTEAEVAAVAARVKRLLADGTPAGQIAVLARSLEPYQRSIERVFAAHGVPVRPAPRALTDAPIVRFALAAGSLPAGNFASADVLRVIKSSYFRPEALGTFDHTTVTAAEAVIRRGNVLEGAESYLRAAERFAESRERTAADEPPDEGDEAAPGRLRFDASALRAAGAMLTQLFETVAPCGGTGGRPVDTAALAALPEALHLRDAACEAGAPPAIARDLRALDALTAALAEMDPLPRELAELTQALSAVSLPAPRGEELVEVLDVLDARALRYEHVFLLGLNEGGFPRRFAENSLIQEADRGRWSAAGVRLDRRDEIACREMLLFYLGASRADGTLTLSFQAADAGDEPAGTSPFLLSLLEPFGGLEALVSAGRLEVVPPGRFVPPAGELSRPRDAVNAAVAGLFRRDLDPDGAALAWVADEAPDKLRAASRGLWARHRRWRRGACDAFDGRIDEPDLRRILARRFGPEAVFSASQLNAYGQCPWLFFATYVLGLEPLVEPQRRLEPVARGLFVHEVLRRTFETLREQAGGPVRLADADEPAVGEALASAVAAEAERVERTRPPYPALWRLQREQMYRDLSDYLARQRGRDDAEAVRFELGFGLPAERAADADPASRPEPAELATDDGTLRVQGKIDRVDCVDAETGPAWLVIDYKTGSLPTRADMDEGRSVQLPLYAAAVEAAFGVAAVGGEFHRIGGKGETRRFAAGGKTSVEEYAEQRDAVLAKAAAFVESIRAGRFDLLPTHDCPSWCPARSVCRFSPFRRELKSGGEGRDG